MKTKWFSNSLAKQMMSKNDYVLTSEKKRLYVVGFGALTSSAKNTYNIELRDDNENVLASHENLYLDAITKLILGSSPKSKANKDANETSENKPKEAKQTSKQSNKECLYLTFDEAFNKACNMLSEHYEIKHLFGKYSTNYTIELTLFILHEAKKKEHERIKEAKRNEELKSLRQTLELAKAQGNTMLVDAINEMIANKEKE